MTRELVELLLPDGLAAACCACRIVRQLHQVRELPEYAPEPGSGWGCVTCRLPNDGAQAALCDECAANGREPVDACASWLWLHGRVARTALENGQAHQPAHARALAGQRNERPDPPAPKLELADGPQLLDGLEELGRRWEQLGYEPWEAEPLTPETWQTWAQGTSLTLAEARELFAVLSDAPAPPDGAPMSAAAGYGVTMAVAGAWIEAQRRRR